MKKSLITLLLLIQIVNLSSQNSKIEYENFKLQEDKQLVWQKVFDYKASKDSIVNLLVEIKNTNSFLNNLKLNDYTLSGLSNYVKISDVKKLYGVASNTEYKCFIVIDIKDNKYRVSVSNVTFKNIPVTVGSYTLNNEFTLYKLTVKSNNKDFKKGNLAKNTLHSFNKDFIDFFTIKEILKNDW